MFHQPTSVLSEKWHPAKAAYQSSAHVFSLSFSQLAVLRGTCAQTPRLLVLTLAFRDWPESQTVPQWRNHVALVWIQRETLCHLFIRNACIFSWTEKKNDQKPLVINTYCPLLNSIQHSRKAVSLCQITWRSLCVELRDEVHWWWIHLNAQESTLGRWGSARKLTRVGLEGLWTKKVQIVKYHALRFSLWCNGYQDMIATVLKHVCLVFILLQASYRSKLQKRELAQYLRNQGEKNCLISSGCYLLVGLSFSRVWVVEMRIQKIASSSAK